LGKCSNFIKTGTLKQCRDKLLAALQSDLNKNVFEEWEDQIIIHQHRIVRNICTFIAQFLPVRNSISIKN
jgi:hypothetical protein